MQASKFKGKKRKEVHEDYEGFVEKFKPKRTTDDCITPPPVYDAVLEWLRLQGAIAADTPIVRPFWPGKDYTEEEYPEGCCVVDNPPFSILSSILNFFESRSIPFFVFAPGLTLLEGSKRKATAVTVNACVTYENGAKVSTSFLTNLPIFAPYSVITAPSLYTAIKTAQEMAKSSKSLPKYGYPYNVVSISVLHRIAHHAEIQIPRQELVFIRRMDAQIPLKKNIYGAGFLCSDRVAAELKAAELKVAELKAAELKAAELKRLEDVTVFELSERERKIVEQMDLHK